MFTRCTQKHKCESLYDRDRYSTTTRPDSGEKIQIHSVSNKKPGPQENPYHFVYRICEEANTPYYRDLERSGLWNRDENHLEKVRNSVREKGTGNVTSASRCGGGKSSLKSVAFIVCSTSSEAVTACRRGRVGVGETEY